MILYNKFLVFNLAQISFLKYYFLFLNKIN